MADSFDAKSIENKTLKLKKKKIKRKKMRKKVNFKSLFKSKTSQLALNLNPVSRIILRGKIWRIFNFSRLLLSLTRRCGSPYSSLDWLLKTILNDGCVWTILKHETLSNQIINNLIYYFNPNWPFKKRTKKMWISRNGQCRRCEIVHRSESYPYHRRFIFKSYFQI